MSTDTPVGHRLRVGVIGVGHLGQHHARLFASMPDVDLVGVVDTDAARAALIAERSGTHAFTDASALLGRVDAVTVATPTGAHLSAAEPFLARGVGVLVEKPIASSLDEADRLLALAASGRAVLAAGHTERFNPAIAAAWPLVHEPRFVEVHRLGVFPDRSLDIDVIFDLMIHDFDLLLAAVQSEVVSIEAVGVAVLTSRTDIANVRLRFASGCIANLTASRISRDRVRKIRFFQQDAYVSVDCASRETEVYRLETADGRPVIRGGAIDVQDAEPLRVELEDFVAAVRTGGRPRVSGEDGRRALALAARVNAEMQRGR
ncbi:MAG: Gfo/Idh/MocA family protein [Vicinamibacterales bacterium]